MAAPATPNWYLKIPPPFWTLAMLLFAYGLERSFAWAPLVYVRSLPTGDFDGRRGVWHSPSGASARSQPQGTEIDAGIGVEQETGDQRTVPLHPQPDVSRACPGDGGRGVLHGNAAVLRCAGAGVSALQLRLHPFRGSEDAAPTWQSVHGLSPPRAAVDIASDGL